MIQILVVYLKFGTWEIRLDLKDYLKYYNGKKIDCSWENFKI